MPALEISDLRNSQHFLELCEGFLASGVDVRFCARGLSMQPNILDGDVVTVTPAAAPNLRRGDIALTRNQKGLRVHRIVAKDRAAGNVVTRGDAARENDAATSQVLGKVIAVERNGRKISLARPGTRFLHAVRTGSLRVRRAGVLRARRLGGSRAGILFLFLATFLAGAPQAAGQNADLAVTSNTPVPTTIAPGGQITFTQVVKNNGPNTAARPSVTETTPPNTTFVSMAKTGGNGTWPCVNPPVGGTGASTCTRTTNMASGVTTTFTYVVQVNAATANGTIITDSVAISSATNDPNLVNNIRTATATVQTPDLSMTQIAAPNPVATGSNITYTETVTNGGPDAAVGATLTQNTPANTTFVSAAPPAGWTCGTQPAVGGTGAIICTANGTMAASTTTANFTIIVAVNSAAPGGSTIANTATVTETGTDPNPGNNTTTTSVQVSGADLSMTQTVSAPAVAPGTTITYTESITNNGPNAAVGAVLYQQTPPNTTFASMTPPAGWACGTLPGVGLTGQVICTAAGNINSGTISGNFTFVVTVGGAIAAGTTIVNYADATSQTTDPVAANNATSTSVLVETAANADLGVSMAASPTPVFIASTLTYTIQVQNFGLAAAASATVTDTLPVGVSNVNVSTSQGSCTAPGASFTCNLGAVAYPLAPPITITVTLTTPLTATTLTNTATVSAPGDPVPGNNTAAVMTVVQPLVCATPGRDGAGGSLSGVVNTYYAGTGTAAAGSNTITVSTPSSGSATQIAPGDLLIVIQMQGAQINSTNTSSYGDGVAGDPGSGSTSLGSSGQFEFVTATAVAGGNPETITIQGTGANGGLLNSYTSAVASAAQGAQTFQVIRVPQYTSATLSSTLAALPWTGAVGGVLALDVASQLTLSGAVSLDGQGFRGAGGRILGGGTGLATDYVTLSTNNANGSKAEGVAGTPTYVAPSLASITTATTAINTAQTYVEGIPNGSYSRGAPGNAGGGATDADPPANDQNSGGGAGGNGGAGGVGGFGWKSAGIVGGFGGVAFPASTSAIVMGGGGGAGTTNNGSWWDPIGNTGGNNCGATCTGIYSSGTAGGGIVIIHAGSATGTGTITANGQTSLEVENDGGGGGGAGGTILLFANSGGLAGLTASAAGGDGGITWPEQAPGAFPGNRHGPGGGGGGGVLFLSGTPASADVSGGFPGASTLADDPYGATPGSPGVVTTNLTISQTPGTQSGAECASADLDVTSSGSPNPVIPGNDITYTQTVVNNGPADALNAVFSEPIPANTTFVSLIETDHLGNPSAAWTCTTSGGLINCTDPDVPVGAANLTNFSVVVQVNPGTTSGTQIVDIASVTAGTTDPNLANNSATVLTLVALANTADLSITNTPGAPTVLAGGTISYTVVVTNNGPGAASAVDFTEVIPSSPAYATFGSLGPVPGGWACVHPASGAAGTISCTIASLGSGATATFTFTIGVSLATPSGTIISETANVSSSTTDPNPSSNSATANVLVATAGQSDLAVTSAASPNPVLAGNNISYTQTVTNNGPAIASATFTDAIPANTTFVSLGVPGGWNCGATIPPVGGTGTIQCTDATFGAGPGVSFPLVVKVNTATPPGTTISNTATASLTPSTLDPNPANNSATATTVVASPTQADLSILKTGSPSAVDQGTNLTYTLQVTNNGPAVAQSVVVTDPLPSGVTFSSVSTTQGSCPAPGATVTCNLGSISVGGLAIVTINVNASSVSAPTQVSNTATVSSSTGDPNMVNNSSTALTSITTPTAVTMVSFQAQLRASGGVILEWRTREETRNLGFHVYREDGEGRHRLDPSLIAGAALFLRGARPQHGAKTYQWLDPQGAAQSSYWIEDVDLNGTRTMHGPVSPNSVSENSAPVAQARLLNQLNASAPPSPAQDARPLTLPRDVDVPPIVERFRQRMSLDTMPAVKISVTAEGWYRVTSAQLAAAGLNPYSDAHRLQLYAEGIEQPLLIAGNQTGPLGPNDSVEFYGTGLNTPFSGTRVYWLVEGPRPGMRIPAIPSAKAEGSPAQSFPFTVLFEQRTTYFAALLNGDNADNFFGAVITSAPVDQNLTVVHSDPGNSSIPVTMDVTLQGATEGQPHRVAIAFNGSPVGEMDFMGQANVTNTFNVDSSLLHDGANTVVLTALNGDNDVSLVQSIALHYPHTYAADSDWLRATASGGATIHITGFADSRIQVFDVTNPRTISELTGSIAADGAAYGITLTIPDSEGPDRSILAFSSDQVSSPANLSFHAPSSITEQTQGADIVIISHPSLASSLAPLVSLRESQGHTVALVTVDQLFDAYNYGESSPFAIRDYLSFASTRWRKRPQAVLLVGDASLDPRDFLGFGDFDLVPTRIIETAAFKTASDDWFTDFNETGFATIPTGRIPARTAADAALVVSKIVNYERGTSDGTWTRQALVVADQNIGVDFSAEANFASAALPKSLIVTKILADGQDPSTVTQQLLSALNNGALLVNYTGHGSEEQWSFSDLLDDSSAASLTNGGRLPVYLLMDCLNGFFHDVYGTSLATSLLLAPNGGAVAVWASSGFTDAAPQATMDQSLLQTIASAPSIPIGQAILQAKSGIIDPDVRRTWILFGDPSMRLQLRPSPRAIVRLRPAGSE